MTSKADGPELPEGTDQEPSVDLEVNRMSKSSIPGTETMTAVEQLAHRIETRRENRILITMALRKRLLKTCREIAEKQGYPSKNKIFLTDLVELHDQAKENFRRRTHMDLFKSVGFHDNDEKFMQVLAKALVVVNEIQAGDDDWFYYQDFNFYYTKVIPRWPWMRNSLSVALVAIFAFYLFTPILFCLIYKDDGICPDDPTSRGRSYYGWVSALYFASTTMSTVGYGDLNVEKKHRWQVFIGACYMILAILVAILAFSAAAERAFSPCAGCYDRLFSLVVPGGYRKDQPLYKQVARLRFLKLAEITVTFFLLNLIGVFASQLFVHNSDEALADEQWRWMDSFYWAIQTTTTIGYGDLFMSFNMRWFQIFYLIFSTYFVGSTLGKLGSLKEELEEVRRRYAWERREVSKGLINDMQGYDHDEKVDQYEFLVASLLTLNKISSSDITPIMDRFRVLAGDDGVITIEDAARQMEQAEDSEADAVLEE